MSSLPLLLSGENLIEQLLQINSAIEQPHPDIIWCNRAEETIDLEIIRSVEEHFLFPPYQSAQKIIIFHRLDLSSEVVQNTLLKKFEEPPEWLQIIITASHPHLLLPTLMSRCEWKAIPTQQSITSNEQLNNLSILTISEKIKVAEKYKDRGQAIDIIFQLLDQHIQLLHTKPSLKITSNIQRLQKTLPLLQNNTNVRLSMEWCLFGLQ